MFFLPGVHGNFATGSGALHEGHWSYKAKPAECNEKGIKILAYILFSIQVRTHYLPFSL